MAMTAREAAWTALQRWRKNGAWSDAALNAVLQGAQLEPRSTALTRPDARAQPPLRQSATASFTAARGGTLSSSTI